MPTTSTQPIVLIRLGDPVVPVRNAVGDYALWFQRAVDEPLGVVDLRNDDEALPRDAAGYIIMGAPVAVLDPHPWMPRALDAARWILESGRPTLGVCFGHQLFAVAAGGQVARNERVEVGTIDVHLNGGAVEDPLFGDFAGRLRVNGSHDDTITELPQGPRVLGVTDRDAHQVLRWGERAWSVQFHPEMRRAETRMAVAWRSPRLESEGRDPQAVQEAVEEAPDGRKLLRRFVRLVREG
jgi:GMP synthase (glutamine-hydrolysing)